ncbi:MAG: hypothetical protein ACD_3C00001G0021 [uncultured bacterium (gcode 4)]|uniref:Uncharacterized protein n=1 Tax=uncultured bacterium (gcode 4) TaxID=1234023 RepID=K2GZD8_9BACT|nr:MAG: hypothetical protein ACD_3C00001G0021 [uncultured bacterium (gcode 4)]
MNKPKKFHIILILILVFSAFYFYSGKEQLKNYKWDSAIIKDLRDFKTPTLADAKIFYKENNTQIKIPFLNIRFMDIIAWLWLISILLFLILKKLNV